MKKILAIVVMVLFVIPAFSQQKKVLFLGNSYTGANNLPNLVSEMASSAGDELYTQRSTPGGYTLGNPANGHLYDPNSIALIESDNWDYVVLQEQSQYPVIDYYRDHFTFTGAAGLDSIIRLNSACGQSLFYMTWGRKYGGQQCIGSYCSVDFVDYAHMQDSLASAYLSMSDGLNTPVAPVGIAWRNSIVGHGDPVELFATDGSHPSVAGSYLAACVFYASIFHKSPLGINYTAGLDENTAAYLQELAQQTVFNNLELWHIDTTSLKAQFEFQQQSDTVFFTNLSVHAEQYWWDFGNGDTDTTTHPEYVYPESGVFEVQLIASSACKSDTVIHIIEVVIDHTDLLHSDNRINFYPNPCKDSFSFNNKALSGNTQISLVDTHGIIRFTENRKLYPGHTETFYCPGLQAGVYRCLLQTESSLVTGGIVVYR